MTWQSETFAYADGWDKTRKRYKGLKTRQAIRVLTDGQSVLMKPAVAAAQMQAESQQLAATEATTRGDGTGARPSTAGTANQAGLGPGAMPPATSGRSSTPVPQLRRFHASVTIDPLRLGRDASQIAEEIVQHLTRIVGAQVEITFEIQAELADGAPDKLVRDVTENCRTLRFNNYGFEEA